MVGIIRMEGIRLGSIDLVGIERVRETVVSIETEMVGGIKL